MVFYVVLLHIIQRTVEIIEQGCCSQNFVRQFLCVHFVYATSYMSNAIHKTFLRTKIVNLYAVIPQKIFVKIERVGEVTSLFGFRMTAEICL